MKSLTMVKELTQLSKSQIKKATELTKYTKSMSYFAGGLLGATAIMNLYNYSKTEEDNKSDILLSAGCAALASVISFKSAGSMGKLQRMLKIAEKFSTVA